MKALIVVGLCLTLTSANSFANEGEMQQAPQEDVRGTDAVPRKTWDKAWSGYFGRDLPDPLADPNMTPEEWNRQREAAAQHAQAGAQFTEAATSVVTAGLPAPTGAAGAATQMVSETAQGSWKPKRLPHLLSRVLGSDFADGSRAGLNRPKAFAFLLRREFRGRGGALDKRFLRAPKGSSPTSCNP
jgi:hypothetical protein